MFKKLPRGLVVVVFAVLLLSGCASPGPEIVIPFNMPTADGGTKRITMVTSNQRFPRWMTSAGGAKLSYKVQGDVTSLHRQTIAKAEEGCREVARANSVNAVVNVVSYGLLYGIPAYAAGGIAASAFPGAVASQHALYIGTLSLASGAASGVVANGGKAFTFANCGANAVNSVSGNGVEVVIDSPYP